ncbi:precorrin-8X methylmutase [Sedimentibacter hydroxybenzoicus DSM 7310]|uniref:Precorrin-8X methylmutase n=2 Tax=Sedimentibacter hydroxybenzoicus TaxID=29345 RepID=A0A974BLH7_SEDHY|nr:precorrin-8X methylmutase [Sedimentibacter hydroxybenzoicus DSM 7310]
MNFFNSLRKLRGGKMENIIFVEPNNIEKRSFEIIQEEMGEIQIEKEIEPIVKRVIHTSADFDYLDNMCFSKNAVKKAKDALKNGATIVTDTNMAYSGINKKAAAKYGVNIQCFMADEDVAKEAAMRGETRAAVSMERAAMIKGPLIFAVGNAPTALIKLYEMIKSGMINPEVIIGVPVGFVNVVEAKELIMSLNNVEYIVARGRKGGSNIAASICNALLYNI